MGAVGGRDHNNRFIGKTQRLRKLHTYTNLALKRSYNSNVIQIKPLYKLLLILIYTSNFDVQKIYIYTFNRVSHNIVNNLQLSLLNHMSVYANYV